MPDFGSATFSQTDASNATGTMPSWSGAAAPSTLDDAGRALQGAVTREWNWRSYTLTAAGTADAKTLSFSVAPAAYYNGQRFAFIANTTNTASATLNVNSLGAKTIKKLVAGVLTNLSASDMVSGMFVEVAYNTSNDCFVWVNQSIATSSANTWSAVQTFTASPVISVTDNTNAALLITQLGTGYALRVEDDTNPDSTPFVVDASGNVGIGTTTMTSKVNYSGAFNAASAGSYPTLLGGGSFGGGMGLLDTAVSGFYTQSSGTELRFFTGQTGADTAASKVRFVIDGSNNILNVSSGGLGYGTGSGGTVTQITSKSTGVTLNKTNGQIVTSNAALGSGQEVSFVVTNSTVAATDTVIVHRASGGTNETYSVYCDAVAAGSFRVGISNTTAASASEALTLNFAVIKAVTA